MATKTKGRFVDGLVNMKAGQVKADRVVHAAYFLCVSIQKARRSGP